MVKIDLSTWGVNIDDHTNKMNSKFFNLTPSSQGAGLDVEFQNSLQNSDYYYRKDPKDSISEEIEGQKTSGIIFRFKDRRALNNNLGFKKATLKDVVENVRNASVENYDAILNDQINNEQFEQNIQKYFNITGMQQFDQNMAVLFDQIKKQGILLPDERQMIEQMIISGDPRIIMDSSFINKIITDPDLMNWLINYIRHAQSMGQPPQPPDKEKEKTFFDKAKEAYESSQTWAKRLKILKKLIKMICDMLKAYGYPCPGAFQQFLGGDGGPGGGPGGGGGGGPGGGGGGGGGPYTPGPTMRQNTYTPVQGQSTYTPASYDSTPTPMTQTGHNVVNQSPGGTIPPVEGSQEYNRQLTQAQNMWDQTHPPGEEPLPDPRYIGQESTRPTEIEVDEQPGTQSSQSTPAPEGLGDHDNMLYEAIAALLVSRTTFQALGLATVTGINAFIARTLRNHMPQRFRNNALAVIGAGQPIYLMVQQLIHMGGSALVNAVRNGYFGANVADVGEFMAEFIRGFMNHGLPQAQQRANFRDPNNPNAEEIRNMNRVRPHISTFTNEVLRRIIDLVQEINRDGVNRHRINEFSTIKQDILTHAQHRTAGSDQLLDVIVESLASGTQPTPYTVSANEWLTRLVQNLFDDLKVSQYSAEQQRRILSELREANKKIKGYDESAEQSTSGESELIEGRRPGALIRSIEVPVIRTQIRQFLNALKSNDNKLLTRLVNTIKSTEFSQNVQIAVDETDRTLSGKRWIAEYVQSLHDRGFVNDEVLNTINTALGN